MCVCVCVFVCACVRMCVFVRERQSKRDVQDCNPPDCRVVPLWLCLSLASGHRRGCHPRSQWLKAKGKELLTHSSMAESKG